MNYHPIMGITLFFVCILFSYFYGCKVRIKMDSKKIPLNTNMEIKKTSNEFNYDVLGAQAPDAPWLRNQKINKK